jgi:G3E family GTPase
MVRVPFITVTGFLGSGKTTLINEYLKRWRNERVLVVVNEFGDVSVDHQLIVTTSGPPAVALAGGCLCCAFRGTLARSLEEALAAWGSSGPLDRIIIETSGLASPARVERELMSDPDLAPQLRVGGVVACLDVIAPPWSLSTRPIALEQLAIADQIVLTKGMLARHRIAPAAAFAAGVNPDAELLLEPFQGSSAVLAETSLFRTARMAMRPICIESPPHPEVERLILRPPAWPLSVACERIARLCAAAGERLLRAKGFIRAAAGDPIYAVHAVAGLFYPPVALSVAATPEPVLVLIGSPGLKLAIESLVSEWEADHAGICNLEQIGFSLRH